MSKSERALRIGKHVSLITQSTGLKRVLIALLAGATTATALPPYDLFFVCFLSMPVLVWLLDDIRISNLESARKAFYTGWLFGLGYFVAGLWWIGNALLVEAEMFAWAIPLAVLGLPALLAIFYGTATMLASFTHPKSLIRILALAVSFTFVEWLRSFVLTGFPWNPIGQTIMPAPIAMQSLVILGLNGMNAMAVIVFAMPALFFNKPQRFISVTIAATLSIAHIGFGFIRLSNASENPETLFNVRIVQPSIDQAEKWDAQIRDRILKTYLDMSSQPTVDDKPLPELIVWPETSVPFVMKKGPDALTVFADLLKDGQTLLAGAVRTEGEEDTKRYYNSVMVINNEGVIYDAVDKMWLVPFGEYLPFGDVLSRLGFRRIVESVSDFSAAEERHTIEISNRLKALPYICYEIIFSDTATSNKYNANVIINITNDAWFGNTPGPHQHFRQAQLRAIETGLPLVRAANNGISGVIDKYGRIIDKLALDDVGIIDIAVPQ